MHFYTSINNNYLAKARVLAKSVKQYCKDAKFSLVLSDRVLEDIDWSKEPFDEIITCLLYTSNFDKICRGLW